MFTYNDTTTHTISILNALSLTNVLPQSQFSKTEDFPLAQQLSISGFVVRLKLCHAMPNISEVKEKRELK